MTLHDPSDATEPLVTLDRVSVSYPNGTRALDRLSLALYPGEVLALLGPSGCGKSTALRTIAGLVPHGEGTVRWSDPGDRGRLGVVFQSPTLMPWASVAANVGLPLRLQRRAREKVEEAVAEALDLVGLSGAARLKPRQLSGGMAMRVSIARALTVRPKLILMDEPFAALDEIARHRLNDELLAIRAATGCAVLFVTHSVGEACYLADRIVVMAPSGREHATVGVDLGRRVPSLRGEARFAALTARVSAALGEATQLTRAPCGAAA